MDDVPDIPISDDDEVIPSPEQHLKNAKMANSLGLISVMLCLVSPCSSCMSVFLAFPLAMMGMHYARTVLSNHPTDVAEAYAQTGLTLSIVSLAYSVMILLVIFAYVMMYVVIIVLAVAGGL